MVNTKIGLSYFAVDTDMFQDRKIKQLKRNFGCQGIAILFYLLAEVYRDKGCGLEWDENTALDVADYLGVKETLVNEVVKYCGVVGLFNEALLSGGIITSEAIQRRYIEMSKRAKRTSIVIPDSWRIIHDEEEDSDNLPEIFSNTSRNLPETFLPKEKKSKVKESKEKESMCEDAHTHTLAHEDERFNIFQKFCIWCQHEAPLSLQFKEPLSFENFLWLRERYSTDLIKRCAKELHNKEAYAKNRNAFYTWQSWIAKLR